MTHLHLGTQANGQPFRLPLAALDRHLQIAGPTGSGKTRLLVQLFQELVGNTDACIVVLDPKGGMHRLLRRWCYSQSLDDRLLVIDPNDRRMVCGFNPVQPWADDHDLQVRVARELILRAMGQNEALATPRMSRWLDNILHVLIEMRLTLAEALLLLDYASNAGREAVLPHLAPSPARSDLEWLGQVTRGRGESQSGRLLDDHLGAVLNRFRHILGNPALRAMYGTTRSLDWRSVVDQRQLVLVNLQRRHLDGEAQRLLGLQIVSELTREVFRRNPREVVPVYLILDEASLFVTPDLIEGLDRGRELGLKVVLAHQHLGQFIDPKTGDRQLLDSIMNDARTKIVFGGLAPRDADEFAAMLFRHHLDPDKVQLALKTLRQLSRVEESRSTTESWGVTHGVTSSTTRSHATGRSSARGSSHGTTRGEGRSHGSGLSSSMGMVHSDGVADGAHMYVADGGLDPVGLSHVDNSSSASSAAFGESHSSSDSQHEASSESVSEVEGTSEMEGVAESAGAIDATTMGRSVTTGRTVMPTEAFEELSSVQFESLEVQLHRFASELVRHPDRHAFAAVGKEPPTPFVVATVEDPEIDEEQSDFLDLRRMRKRDYYSKPAAIEAEIAARHAKLLTPSRRPDAGLAESDLPAVFGPARARRTRGPS